MTPFLLEIPPRGQIEEIGTHSRVQAIGYHGDPEREHALEAILRSLEEFAGHPENREMVCKTLDYCAPELSILAGHVAAIHRLESVVADRDLDDREKLAVDDLRKQTANVWAHGRAGQILIDSQLPLDDQHAVCDPSEVTPETREPMTKYRAEHSEEFPGVDWFSQKPCQITFEQHASRTINDGWRYSQYWTRVEWPRQALRDCDKRIASVDKDRATLQDVRTGLVEICAEMAKRQGEDAMEVEE